MSPPLLPSLVTFALSVRGDRAGREAGAFRDERCEREHLCKNARQQTQLQRLPGFGVNPDVRIHSGRGDSCLFPHSPLGERRKRQLFP